MRGSAPTMAASRRLDWATQNDYWPDGPVPQREHRDDHLSRIGRAESGAADAIADAEIGVRRESWRSPASRRDAWSTLTCSAC